MRWQNKAIATHLDPFNYEGIPSFKQKMKNLITRFEKSLFEKKSFFLKKFFFSKKVIVQSVGLDEGGA